jgi:hypothetical protein
MMKEVKQVWVCKLREKLLLLEVWFFGRPAGLPKLSGSPQAVGGMIWQQISFVFLISKP